MGDFREGQAGRERETAAEAGACDGLPRSSGASHNSEICSRQCPRRVAIRTDADFAGTISGAIRGGAMRLAASLAKLSN